MAVVARVLASSERASFGEGLSRGQKERLLASALAGCSELCAD